MHIILRNVGSVSLRALPGADTGFIKGVGMEGHSWVAGSGRINGPCSQNVEE